jgi:hypothetical protein
VIPPDGGRLEAAGVDGTVYRLEVPANALETTTTITMTPIVRFDGLPIGDKRLGVHLAPDGLQAFRSLTLTIQPQGDYPLRDAFYFSFDDEQGRMAPVIAPFARTAIQIPILHFSSYATMAASSQEVRAALTTNAQNSAQAMKSEIALLIHEMRSAGLEYDSIQPAVTELMQNHARDALWPAVTQALQDGTQAQAVIRLIIEQWVTEERLAIEFDRKHDLLRGRAMLERYGAELFDSLLRSEFAAVDATCDGVMKGIARFLSMLRQRELLGVDGGPGEWTLVERLTEAAAMACVLEEYERCINDHVIHRMPFVWLKHMRLYELIGGAEGSDSVSGSEATISSLPPRSPWRITRVMVRSCLTVRLDFRSTGSFEQGADGFTSDVEARIVMPPDLELMFKPFWKGKTDLKNVRFDMKGPSECAWTGIPGGGTFEAYKMQMMLSEASLDDPYRMLLLDWKLNYFPGKTSESYEVKCGDAPKYVAPPAPLWTGAFNVMHAAEGPPYEVSEWELRTGSKSEILARKEWNSFDSEGWSESGSLEIVHAPVALPMDRLRQEVAAVVEGALDAVRRSVAPRR